MPDSAPSYVSARSAGIILSEIRPTKIKPEALLSINVLLDETLWLLLSSARSLSTHRLKSDGLLKVLPTTLGKEALLEAEVELRAYWDRTDPTGRGATEIPAPKSPDFPLQPAFELLRHKCQVYSTLGDQDEDIALETKLQEALMESCSNPPSAPLVAPAALYITAILEQICEHVLSNVAKVVARDSSRTTARLQDLYVALCEDDAIYPLFKRMKVKEQIELQTRSTQPRRSQSVSRKLESPPLRSSMSSPQPSQQQPDGASGTKSRKSGDSSGNASSGNTRGSIEKAKGLKIFGGTSDAAQNVGSSTHHRSESTLSDGTSRPLLGTQDDADTEAMELANDFDELMRSGTTMKVSLTPDRLKTFEVFAKEKVQRSSRSNSTSNASPGVSVIPLPPRPLPLPSQKLNNKPSRQTLQARGARVEAIEEDEEPTPVPSEPGLLKPRSRTQSLAQFLSSEPPPWDGKTTQASVPPAAMKPGAPNTAVADPAALPTVVAKAPPITTRPSRSKLASPAIPASSPPSSYAPPRSLPTSPMNIPPVPALRGSTPDRDSIDLDDILNDDYDDDGPPKRKHKPKGLLAKQASSTSSSRDLIDFLSEGPPQAMPPPVESLASSNAKPKSTSRFGRMVSRLARSGSSDHLPNLGKKPGSSAEDLSRSSNGLASSFRSGVTLLNRPTHSSRKNTPAPSTPPTVSPLLHAGSSITPSTSPSLTRAPTESRPKKSPSPAPLIRPSSAKGKLENSRAALSVSPASSNGGSELSEQDTSFRRPSQISVSSAQPGLAVTQVPARNPSVSSASVSPADAKYSTAPEDPNTSSSSKIDLASRSTSQSPTISATGSTPASQRPLPDEARATPEAAMRAVKDSASPQMRSLRHQATQATGGAQHPAGGSSTVTQHQAEELRTTLGRATTAEESRVIVEMFLARWGLGRAPTEAEPTSPVAASFTAAETTHQPSVVELLLGDTIVPSTLDRRSEGNNTDEDLSNPKTPQESLNTPHSYSSLTSTIYSAPYSSSKHTPSPATSVPSSLSIIPS